MILSPASQKFCDVLDMMPTEKAEDRLGSIAIKDIIGLVPFVTMPEW